ncbi:MAG: hypothetical protein JG777_2672 [Clostridia bacterium]|nr:hypothetical protein [Clostridia bacterium]
MHKRILILVLTVITILSTMAFAAESTTTATEPARQEFTFSQDTVITEDNMNDILEYYGLNASAAIKKNKPVNGLYYNKKVATVRDLETAIKKLRQLPDTITIHDDNPTGVKVTTNATSTSESSSITVFYDSQVLTHFSVRYSASGKYYKNGTTKYWTEAYGGNITGLGSSGLPGTSYEISKISKCTNTLKNGGTTSSYLQLDYKYTVKSYVGVGDWSVPVTENTVEGFTRFGTSYIP